MNPFVVGAFAALAIWQLLSLVLGAWCFGETFEINKGYLIITTAMMLVFIGFALVGVLV